MDVSTIILEYVCPTMGAIIANFMFSAPIKSVQEANKRGRLGDLNPTPWAFMMGNCLGWVAYSYLIQNYFVFFANAPGFLMSVWLNLSAAKLQFQSFREGEVRKSVVSLLQRRQSEHYSSSHGEKRWSLVAMSSSATAMAAAAAAAAANDAIETEARLENGEESPEQQGQEEVKRGTDATANGHDRNGSSNGCEQSLDAKALETTTTTTLTTTPPPPQQEQQEQQEHDNDHQQPQHNDDDDDDADWAHFEWSAFSTMLWQVASQEMVAPAPHERVVLTICILWLALLSALAFGKQLNAATVVGLANNLNLLFFYGAPLSTIVTVLRRRNSASIHIRTMITNTANGAFWSAYGISILDFFIAIPNGIGVALGVIQIVLCLIFPRTAAGEATETSTRTNQPVETSLGTAVAGEKHRENSNDDSDNDQFMEDA